jgi:hypothetical protein
MKTQYLLALLLFSLTLGCSLQQKYSSLDALGVSLALGLIIQKSWSITEGKERITIQFL